MADRKAKDRMEKGEKFCNILWKKVALLSMILNICILSLVIPYGVKKLIQHSDILRGGGYRSNVQYEAYVSMFELNERKTDIVFLGDSITARGRFEEFFPDKNILNRGIGSDVSEGVLYRLDEVEIHKPSAIFLMIGINDLGHSISVEDIIINVRKILLELESALPECDVYLQSVLPVTTIDLTAIRDLNNEYKSLAEDFGKCTYIDIYTEFVTEKGEIQKDLISGDGVHLNGKGYKAWINKIENIISFY